MQRPITIAALITLAATAGCAHMEGALADRDDDIEAVALDLIGFAVLGSMCKICTLLSSAKAWDPLGA